MCSPELEFRTDFVMNKKLAGKLHLERENAWQSEWKFEIWKIRNFLASAKTCFGCEEQKKPKTVKVKEYVQSHKFILKLYWQWKKWAAGCWRQDCTWKIAPEARRSGKRNYIWINWSFRKINCPPIQIFHWRWPKVDPKLSLPANWGKIASCASRPVTALPSACYHIL